MFELIRYFSKVTPESAMDGDYAEHGTDNSWDVPTLAEVQERLLGEVGRHNIDIAQVRGKCVDFSECECKTDLWSGVDTHYSWSIECENAAQATLLAALLNRAHE